MAEQQTKVQLTDRQFLDEVIQLIDGTHWVKSALACVHIVWETRKDGTPRTKTVTQKGAGRWNYDKREYEDLKVKVQIPKIDPETNRVVTKPTACLVGLILRVEGHDWNRASRTVAEDEILAAQIDAGGVDKELDEDTFRIDLYKRWQEDWMTDQGSRIVRKLSVEIGKRSDSTGGFSGPIPHNWEEITYKEATGAVETWNDQTTTERADVRAVVVAVRDAEPADEV